MANDSRIQPRLVKIKEAAAYLSISCWKLRNLTQQGKIPVILGEGTAPWLYDRKDLDGFIHAVKGQMCPVLLSREEAPGQLRPGLNADQQERAERFEKGTIQNFVLLVGFCVRNGGIGASIWTKRARGETVKFAF